MIKAHVSSGDCVLVHLRAAPSAPQPGGPSLPRLLSAVHFPTSTHMPWACTVLSGGRGGLHDSVPALPELAFLAFPRSVSSENLPLTNQGLQLGPDPKGGPSSAQTQQGLSMFLYGLLRFPSPFLPMTSSLLISHPDKPSVAIRMGGIS